MMRLGGRTSRRYLTRSLAVLALVLAVAGRAQAQDYVLAQQVTQTQTSGGTTCTLTYTALTSGSLLIGWAAIRDGGGISMSSVADGANGAWTAAVQHSSLQESGKIWFFPNNASTGTPTVTFTASATIATGFLCGIAEFTYAGGTAGVTAGLTNEATNTTATNHSHGSISPSAGGLLITAAGEGPALTETVAAGYTVFTDAGLRMWAQYRIISAGETTDGLFTTSTAGTTKGVIAYFAEPGAAPASGRRGTLLGVLP